jgi:curli biogenesis system outer membrane secretion channel CsgG
MAMVLVGCASTAQVTKTGGPSLQEAQQEAYDGPKARVAIAPFVDKSGKGKMTNAIGDGMTDTLTTLLFHTQRFIVLERQALPHVQEEQPRAAARRGRQQSLASKAALEDAELVVTGAVTEFEPEAGGGGVKIGPELLPRWKIFDSVSGNLKQAHIAIALRLIDTRTSRVVAATSVEGKAMDGSVATGGAEKKLDTNIQFKTPIDKAIRLALEEAVQFIVGQTPAEYYRYPSKNSTIAALPSVSFPKFVRVVGAMVKIRTGASETFQPIVTVAKGTRLPVIDAQDQWYKVRVTDGREGWIAGWATATQP